MRARRRQRTWRTASWNRSDIEFTKIRRGFFQLAGMLSASRSSLTLPVQTARLPLLRVSPRYFYSRCAVPGSGVRSAMRVV